MLLNRSDETTPYSGDFGGLAIFLPKKMKWLPEPKQKTDAVQEQSCPGAPLLVPGPIRGCRGNDVNNVATDDNQYGVCHSHSVT